MGTKLGGRNARALGLGLLALLVLASCAPAVRGYGGNGVSLFIANDGAAVVNVTVERDGETLNLGPVQRFEYRRVELGEVPAGNPSTLRVRITQADGAGPSAEDSEFRTDTVRARAGGAIEVHVRWPLHQSTWARY